MLKSLVERMFSLAATNTSNFEKVSKDGYIKYVMINDSKYSNKKPNNLIYIFISNEEKVFKIAKILNVTEIEIEVEGNYIMKLSPFYEKPIRSNLVGVFKTSSNIVLS